MIFMLFTEENSMKKILLIIAIILYTVWVEFVFETNIERNFKRDGVAKTWFIEIKCE